MFDFFLALFGGGYYALKGLSAAEQNKRDKIANEQSKAKNRELTDKYFAPLSLAKIVETYVENHREELEEEYHDDLISVYGQDFDEEKNKPNRWEVWYYSVPETLKHLVLAKEHGKMEHLLTGYSTGYKHEHIRSSLGLIRTINKYFDDKDCKLTLEPSFAGTKIIWTNFNATYIPAFLNPYADRLDATRYI